MSHAPGPAGAHADRPLLRGVSHQLGFFLALPPLYWLLGTARTPEAFFGIVVYGVTLLLLLATSASYHRIAWGPIGRARMERIDHSAIFFLIAGTYTPICLLGVGGSAGKLLCAVIWAGAGVGVAQTLFWPGAPRAVHVGLYVALGWAGAFGLSAEWRRIGPEGVGFHVVGGVLYTLGAVTYARRRPDPWPSVFGFHEIFHVLVLLACACLFEVVRRCVALPG
jgi:hemolysin III